jgi:6-pyruvoyltetrahydropterin/6-carboxytetrahydropterin synthase
MQLQSTKSFWNYPCSHRQWRHDGHCAWIHGYSRSFHFVFESHELTEAGFVVDFGTFKKFKLLLDEWFDHTLLLNADDPLLPEFRVLEQKGACKLTVLSNVSLEGTAIFLWEKMNEYLSQETMNRAYCVQVEVRENDKNSALFKK